MLKLQKTFGYDVKKSVSVTDVPQGALSTVMYKRTCLWLLALLVFGYDLSNVLKAIILKTSYDIQGEKKKQIYRELEIIRAERHKESQDLNAQAE